MVCNRQNPSLGIHESQLDATKLRHSTRLVDISLCRVECQTSVGNMSLFLGQCLPGIGEIGQNDHDDKPDEDGDGTFDYVQLCDAVSLDPNSSSINSSLTHCHA